MLTYVSAKSVERIKQIVKKHVNTYNQRDRLLHK